MKISVIVPVYNSENYVSRCIDSILNQTYKDFELILINDGSKDKSLEILKKYEKKDKRIIVIDQKNMGVAKTRNKGIELANGEYIALVDNDDYLDQDYLEKFVSNCDGYDVIVSGYRRVSEDKILFTKSIGSSPWAKYEVTAPWAKIIRKKFLLENDIKFFSYPIGEDIIFNLNLYTKTNKIKTINYHGYNWFFNTKSVSNTTQKSFDKDILVLFEKMKEYDKNEHTKYFITRYYVWYLLFSGASATSDEFMEEYNKIKKWLNKNGYGNTLSLKMILKNDPSLKNKIIVSTFHIITKLKLVKLFSLIYCKGSRRK